MDHYGPLTSVLEQIAGFTGLDVIVSFMAVYLVVVHSCGRAYLTEEVCENSVPSPEYFDCIAYGLPFSWYP